jgi:hypothetical protein
MFYLHVLDRIIDLGTANSYCMNTMESHLAMEYMTALSQMDDSASNDIFVLIQQCLLKPGLL